jgi:hypothetical protein
MLEKMPFDQISMIFVGPQTLATAKTLIETSFNYYPSQTKPHIGEIHLKSLFSPIYFQFTENALKRA